MKTAVTVVMEVEPLTEDGLTPLEASEAAVRVVRDALGHLGGEEHGSLGICGIEVRGPARHLLITKEDVE